ncbi:MAG TPA: rhomboid family intramembrane serine protease [Vicinamibacterales bacterium]|nr:rhomboid family intramembrane serine protease [Vicinamibacterales bacterium]
MATTVFALLVLSGAALYFMTGQERMRLARSAAAGAKTALRAATHSSAPSDPLDAFLAARTGWPIVTPLLLAVNVAIFTGMLFGRGAIADTRTLLEWGANYAPRTTSGEWWRLATSIFVHGSVLHLLATAAGLLPLGLILERAVGRTAFATVYLASGIVASVVSLWTTSATSITLGASGSLFGMYGLTVATIVWGCIRTPRVPISLDAIKRIAAAAVLCVGYNLLTDRVDTPSELAGLCTGIAGGLIVARGVAREKPPVSRAAIVLAAAVIVAIAGAVPLRGIIDARPELARIAAAEERTAADYAAAVDKFKRGRLSAKALGAMIEHTIIPTLQANRARLEALRGVPREQATLVAAAREYFDLREASWRSRADGLLKGKMTLLTDAERTERAALDALQRIL